MNGILHFEPVDESFNPFKIYLDENELESMGDSLMKTFDDKKYSATFELPITDELYEYIFHTDFSDVNPVDGFECHSCNFKGIVNQFHSDSEGYYDLREQYEYIPNYCPECGHKLDFD